MASIDDLFRKPNAPSTLTTNGKRKLEVRDGDAAYKSTKLSASSDVHGGTTVAAKEREDEEEDELEAGPELPPDEDEGSDDEEGRFYGGGVTKDTKQAIDFLDAAEGEAGGFVDEKIDAAWARRLAVNLERRINKNSEQRARFEGQAEKFMESEAALDAEVKAISILTEHSDFYEEFTKAGGASNLVSLLAHDNLDIAIAAVEIIAELVSDDVEVQDGQWDVLVQSMLEADLINLLVQNLQRCNESADESDREGVYHSLAILEALASPVTVAERAGNNEVIRYLLSRIETSELEISQNKQYAAEVLQIFLQESTTLRIRVIKLGGVDVILQLLAAYRRRDPEENSLEEEFAYNLFNALICIVQEDEGKLAFLDGEGVELMLIMIREGKMSKSQAIKTLDHATIKDGRIVCQRIVEAAGLKTLFGLFKKKMHKKATENLLDILAAMLRFLPGDSPERIRTMAKFSEKKYERVEKLMEWRQGSVTELEKVDRQIAKERQALTDEDQEDLEDDWYVRRLDAGLVVLQTINIILAWLYAEDSGAAKVIQDGLGKHGSSKEDLRKALKDQLPEGKDVTDSDFAEMLDTLIDALS